MKAHCATLMLEGGADERFIQALLGYVSLENTAICISVSIRAPVAVHRAAKLSRPRTTLMEEPVWVGAGFFHATLEGESVSGP